MDFDRSININLRRLLAASNSGLLDVRTRNSDCAVVFVHGFWTESLQTWGLDGDRFWPFELGKETGTDVYCYQYNNNLFGGGVINPLKFESVAKNFAKELLRLNRYQRILFVTHSFGGVVVKQLVSLLARSDPAYRELAGKIFGFCAISCPNHGHRVASMLSRVRGFSHNTGALKWKGKQITKAHERFIAASAKLRNLHVMTIGETGYLFRFFRVDPEDARIGDSDHHESNRNHWDICTDLGSEREEYKLIKTFVELRKAAPGSGFGSLTRDPHLLG